MLHKTVSGSGPDLFLIHGWGMNTAVWGGLTQTLAADYRVTAVDLPGHGHSEAMDGDWVDALLQVAPASAIWLGWSLGGSLALDAALREPQRVRALCLVTATPRFIQDADWTHAMPGATLARFHDALSADPGATLDRFLALQVKGSDDSRGLLRTLRRQLAEKPVADRVALDLGLDLLHDIDLRHRLGGLQVPSLWLFGKRDTLVPWRWSECLPQFLPQAQVRVIEGAAHAPFLSHPRESLESLQGFLEQQL